MTQEGKYKTEQEEFWAGSFGENYIQRNQGKDYLASNIAFFANALKSADQVESCIEFGANIGMNLRALKALFPQQEQHAVEINPAAAEELRKHIPPQNVFEGSIIDYRVYKTFDFSLIKGVLIHINPDILAEVYRKIVESSRRYIIVAEYYNPSPVTVTYRGHEGRLFKRDFAGEMLDAYPELRLVDYGFSYHRDPLFPQDDITWFLLEKRRER